MSPNGNAANASASLKSEKRLNKVPHGWARLLSIKIQSIYLSLKWEPVEKDNMGTRP